MNDVLLRMSNIIKRFPGVLALDSAQLEVKAGEVHALLGENGAGKSTLIKVLGGIYRPESGEIEIAGKKVVIGNIHDARLNGVSIIHQELMTIPEMTIADNIFLGRLTTKKGFLDDKAMVKKAQQLLDEAGLELDANDKLGSLSIANQQMIEILRAISFGARIIVMDEPTSSLTDKEVEVLFQAIRKLKATGIGIIYISHRMSELYEISDRITVMRDGKYIGTVDTATSDRSQLISMMVGRELSSFYTKTPYVPDRKILEVEHLSDGKTVRDVSFDVCKGEILGFAGLIGAGRSETMKCLFGLSKRKSGKVLLDGKEITTKNPKSAMQQGIGLVPENRKAEGMYPQRDISFNTSIEMLPYFIKGIHVNKKKELEIVEKYTTKMRVKTPSLSQLISKLSGGNQQKVIISRWLATNPKVLILDEPTRGIDVGAKSEIYAIINELAKEGMSIVFISSELPELINMCDRIVVMNQGKVAGVLDGNFTQEAIMRLATKDIK
ncbi:sugar ABC transporter ATP-binding protein [uncultured Sphaerochaeta sp.]|uniref:sugar ABC transporter ATP-binding protein n=1 Tax=uncultured Sphaerochaeta sp. TaxID=886478 RepID=UPI002A0A9767|nr:sugar ABC transporter ATP-binding protein [uncultured Sphaerochaeta sp.]